MQKLLLNRNFMLLTFGNLTSKMGSKIYEIILAWWLTQKTGSAAVFGIVSACSLISVVFFNIFSGVIVDRFNKKVILIIADVISAAVCFLVGAVVINDIINIPLLVVAAILLGGTNSLFSPAVKSFLPEIVKKEMIIRANSVTTIVGQVITVVAPLLGGLLINSFSMGLGLGFFVNGASYLFSAVSELLIKYRYKREENKKVSILTDLKEGYIYVIRHKWLVQLLCVSAFVNLFISAYNTVLPMFFMHYYSDKGYMYSWALGAEACFAIIAGLVISKVNKSDIKPLTLKRELLFCGIPIFLLQMIPLSYISILLVGFFGYFLTTFNVYFFSIVQQKVDKEKMGRVFSIIFMVALSIMPIGTLIFGMLSSFIINYVFIIAGIGMILSTLIIRENQNAEYSLNKNIKEAK